MEAIVDLPELPDLPEVVDASVGPRGSLEMLSQSERLPVLWGRAQLLFPSSPASDTLPLVIPIGLNR